MKYRMQIKEKQLDIPDDNDLLKQQSILRKMYFDELTSANGRNVLVETQPIAYSYYSYAMASALVLSLYCLVHAVVTQSIQMVW